MKFVCSICLLAMASLATAQNIGAEDRVMAIYFGGGSYYVDREQAGDLEDFINEIEDIREYEVELHGHTDNIGSLEFNQYLSAMRCEAVLIEVLQLEIDPNIISVHDFGEQSPLYNNDSWMGKRKNRRVDVVLRKVVM